jgi:hypothetical protein
MHHLYFFALAEAAMMGGNAIQFHPLYMKRRIFPFHVYGK